MGRRATAHWHSASRAWRTCAKAPGTTGRQTVYFRRIPFGEVGSPNWHRAQAALVAYLAGLGRTAEPRAGQPRTPTERPDPPAPSRAEIAAQVARLREKRQRGMRDGRAEVDQPGRSCTAPASGRPTTPAGPDAAAVCRRLVRDWRRRTRRNRDLAALPALPCPGRDLI